jgi:transposase
MSKRRNKKTLPDTKDKRIADLEQQLSEALVIIQRQQKQIERLQQLSTQLQAEVEELKRAGKRQATPFARRHWVENPKRPGRKIGKGKFARRERPSLKEVNETKTAKLAGCPECGGKLRERRKHEQFMMDLPEVQPVITRFVTYSGYCDYCHKRMRSWHPDQISHASGAAGVVVGPRAKALAADLKHRLGASYAKVSEALEDAFGLRVSRSGWCQADQQLARTARPVYQELIERVRQGSVVHVDETGWRIGTLAAWLWVFTNREVSVYAIRDNRSSEVVIDILGREFTGILASDGFLAYDDRRLSAWLKQKCVGHLLRDLEEMKESKTGRAVHLARQLSLLLLEALALKAEKSTLDPFSFASRSQALETRLDALIAPQRRLTDRDNARFAKRLRKHRPHLLRFLYMDLLEATNNQAERMLRPAVITRKTNGCNRTRAGANTHAILSSVLVTCHQHSIPILDYLVPLQQYGKALPPLIPTLSAQPPSPALSVAAR